MKSESLRILRVNTCPVRDTSRAVIALDVGAEAVDLGFENEWMIERLRDVQQPHGSEASENCPQGKNSLDFESASPSTRR
jgi:hypothetical protein